MVDTSIDPQLLELDSRQCGLAMSPLPSAASNSSGPSCTGHDDSAIPEDKEDDDDDDCSDCLDAQQSAEADKLFDIVAPLAQLDIDSDATLDDSEGLLLDSLIAVDTTDSDQDPRRFPSAGFVDFFSKVNIVRHTKAGRMSEIVFQEEAFKFFPTGNSRDAPTRYVFFCINRQLGCAWSSHNGVLARLHYEHCQVTEAKPIRSAGFKCRKAGCNSTFNSKSSRSGHERNHDFEPRPCSLGCTDGKIFTTHASWVSHVRCFHDADWDTAMTCPVPGCSRQHGFRNRVGFRQHLKLTHHLSADARKEYIPKSAYRGPIFGKRSCPFQDCERAAPGRELDKRSRLEDHLTARGIHGLTPEEAKKMIDDMLNCS